MSDKVLLIGGPAHGQTRTVPLGIDVLDVMVIRTAFGDPERYRYVSQVFRCHGDEPYAHEDFRVMAPAGATHADTFKKLLECATQGVVVG